YEKITGAKLTNTEEMLHITKQPATEVVDGDEFDPLKTPGTSPRLRTERSNRYNQFLEANDEPVDGVVSQEALKKAMAKLGQATAADKIQSAKVETIDEERQAFAKALFEEADKKTKRRK
ncbi:MAG: hypothetical protein V4692_10115, partial [Bdellovibrionota bacterium]